ncbi:MAG: 16S rRNA (cytosine(967)-C(5))-methyltransferase RsmB [Faecalibacterium prausnitzii]|nr:16S rRNA (cytosine(967)-C(5))-methyltransferase RsmB [Faecalibacterium prausnitzii]
MGASPRAAAVSALIRQEQDGFSNLILDAELRRQKLDGRDKAFASAIFYTVLEHRGTLDYILEQFLPKGLARLDPPVREILRSALAQARYMQVPVSAAVNEAVKLTRSFKKSSASGLVNAVLRRACAYDLSGASFADACEQLMVLGSAGRDVAQVLHTYYPDEALGILTQPADGGLTSLRANPLKATPEKLCTLLEELGVQDVHPGFVEGSVLARFEGSPADKELFRQGYYHVEGQASQLAALCVEAAPGQTVLDLCAAPGGKTLLLAEQMQDTGRLVSCDVTENRVGLIRTAVQRMGFACVETRCNDAAHPAPDLPMADCILTDVPCSGLGILAKKPDIRYKALDEARYAQLLATQASILDAAAGLLKPGGRLVYSTCTIHPAENQQQIQAFLQRHPEFTLASPSPAMPQGMRCTPYGMLSIPTETGMDGFFICAMQKSPC